MAWVWGICKRTIAKIPFEAADSCVGKCLVCKVYSLSDTCSVPVSLKFRIQSPNPDFAYKRSLAASMICHGELHIVQAWLFVAMLRCGIGGNMVISEVPGKLCYYPESGVSQRRESSRIAETF